MASSRDNENKGLSAEAKGWWDIGKDINRLRKSNELQVLARKSKKDWEPMIDNLELLVKQAKEKHKTLAEDKSKLSVAEQKNEKDKIEEFIKLAEKMIEQAKNLTESVSFDLYKVNSEEEAKKVNSKHAVVIYPDEKGIQKARVINKKIDSDRAYDLYCVKFDEKPSEDLIRKKKIEIKNIPLLIKHGNDVYVYGSSTGRRDTFELKKLNRFPADKEAIFPSSSSSFFGSININKINKSKKHRDIYDEIKEINGHIPDIDTIVAVPDSVTTKLLEKNNILSVDKHYEVDVTEDNINYVSEVTKELSILAGANIAEKSTKELVSGALQLAESLPAVLKAFRELPLAKEAGKALEQFKAVTEELNVSGLIKEILPINDYLALRGEVFKLLKAEEFNKRSPDEKAGILALLEVYNEAIKYSVLALDKIEIEAGLAAGSLSTSIKVVENKSIKDLCDEFNANYENAMKLAGYQTLPERYPYTASIQAQRNEMLAALPEDKDKPSIKKARITSRMQDAGEVKELPERKNAQGFYAFMKETLRENYERVKELQQKMKKPAEDAKSNKKQKNITEQAEEAISKIDNELKNILDENIYNNFFVESGKEVNSQDHWIKQAGNAFVNVKQIMARIKLLQSEHDKVKATDTPFARLEERAKELDEIASATIELTTALHSLKEDPYLSRLITNLPQQIMLASLPSTEAVKAEAKSVTDSMNAIRSSMTPLKEFMNELKGHVKKGFRRNEDKIQDKAIEALDKASTLAGSLDKMFALLDKQAGEKPNLVIFAISNYAEVLDALKSLPEILSTLEEISNKDAKAAAVKINQIMKDMVLLCDKLEIQFCLKEWFLANQVRLMMNGFQSKISEMGYTFEPEQKFPYDIAIAKQRIELLKDKNLFASLIQARQIQVPDRAKDDAFQPSKHDVQNIDEIINQVIAQHILRLRTSLNVLFQDAADLATFIKDPQAKKSIGSYFSQSLKQLQNFHRLQYSPEDTAIKIQLLGELFNMKEGSLDERLQKLRKAGRNDIHLLYEGNTGIILQELQYKGSTQDDIFNALEAELEGLKKQRGNAHFIHSIGKAKILEDRIRIFEELQTLVRVHTIDNAIKKLGSSDKDMINKYDKEFIARITLIESFIPDGMRIKTVLGGGKAKNDAVQNAESDVVKDEKHAQPEQPEQREQREQNNYVNDLIEKRINELESSLLKTATKNAKTDVLKTLKSQLVEGVSLDAAIKHVKTHKDTRDNAHLIFEGRTGKTIRAAQNATITRDQLIHRIDAEINSLKHQRYSKLYVFASQRKGAVDGQLEALQALKAEIQKDKNSDVHTVIQSLKEPHKRVLERYESDLLKDLNKFKNSTPNTLKKPM